MHYIRPFELSSLAAGEFSNWIVSAEEGFGVAIRGRRGGVRQRNAQDDGELIALILSGSIEMRSVRESQAAEEGCIIHIPARAEASLNASDHTLWLEIESWSQSGPPSVDIYPKIVRVDAARFVGSGFAYQSLVDRKSGCSCLRLNLLQVQPGSGSPDFHIHAFAQLYVILDGEMTLDIGTTRGIASKGSIVCLPPGVVHRNFNGSQQLERHVSLLVPEPEEGVIFDYAVTILEREAELLTALPKPIAGRVPTVAKPQ